MKPVRMLVREVLSRALDLAAPPFAFDGEAGAQSSGWSAQAWTEATFLEHPVCDGCGAPFEHDLGPGVRCAPCQARPFLFSRARAACLYDDRSRDLILPFKHADRTDLAPLFARWIERSACDLLAEAQVIAPVPIHPLRLLRRRYNQAAEIARPLARRAGIVYLPDAVVRRRATPSQGGKSASGRRRNVAGAFAVTAFGAAAVAGLRVLLIDDVMTTGATAEACARALLHAGARAVDVAVVARASTRSI
jgi:ComF family protein